MSLMMLLEMLGMCLVAIVDNNSHDILAVGYPGYPGNKVRDWVGKNGDKYFVDPDGPRTRIGTELVHSCNRGSHHIFENEAYILVFVDKKR